MANLKSEILFNRALLWMVKADIMANLKSEILFNRALLWIALAGLSNLAGAEKWLIVLQCFLALLNFWKSFKAWEMSA